MSTVKPYKRVSSDETHGDSPNILEKNFDQPAPNMVWCCDFTYIRVANRYYYLCAILDLYSRKIVAYKVSPHIDTQLAIDTLNLAIASRGKPSGLIFHTDRGSQFTSKTFRQYTDSMNIVQSFSAKGHPYDNAAMECFFKYLKKEETNRRTYSSAQELNLSLFTYINGFYNSVRPHSHNNGLTPNEKDDGFMKS